VKEANLIAKEMKRKVQFDPKIVKLLPEGKGDLSEELKMAKNVLQVKVTNNEEGSSYLWDEEKFNNRLFIIKDLVEEFFETGKLPVLLFFLLFKYSSRNWTRKRIHFGILLSHNCSDRFIIIFKEYLI
jgi:hypothetical protein